jgi:hypothetical protein
MLSSTEKHHFQLLESTILTKRGSKALQFVADGGMGTLLSNKKLVESGNSISLTGLIKKNYPSI